jgi:hypothetical protein
MFGHTTSTDLGLVVLGFGFIFGIIFNMIVFVLPGAVVVGLGALVADWALSSSEAQHVARDSLRRPMWSGPRKSARSARN